jgi:hypothetical protein
MATTMEREDIDDCVAGRGMHRTSSQNQSSPKTKCSRTNIGYFQHSDGEKLRQESNVPFSCQEWWWWWCCKVHKTVQLQIGVDKCAKKAEHTHNGTCLLTKTGHSTYCSNKVSTPNTVISFACILHWVGHFFSIFAFYLDQA